ncbi:ankyrin repeat domain-containing protein 6 isoform X2 [Denticeps clupeoides]|uniref:ankyrin repeat domain-containing protein 6 isoform X2 n=1 Tax=Denticeps clupeoides TaxID=299321 RepID=UPI0010A3EE3C|nr:ankyrin repeat domain-containing protein 6-like isoform X2 [Denticeps clupeoides]
MMCQQTALHRASVVGNRDVISALIQGGCALDLQDKDGNTALHELSWHGFSQSIKLLVKAGADVHIKNKAGNTALHLASQNGHCQSTRVLLLGGSRPDNRNNAGDTCLHAAARHNHLAVIKILLGALCSVTEKNQAGETALHVAATLNHKKTIRLLLESGADSSLQNNAGQTALDKAHEQQNREVALVLAKASQAQRFARARTVRRRREQQRVGRQSHSVPREQVPHGKDSTSVAEDTQSSDPALCRKRNNPRAIMTTKIKDGPTGHGNHVRRPGLSSPAADMEEAEGKVYTLYTLFRDKEGKIKQVPASDCHCKPLIKKLESQLKATKKEMRSEIHTVQEQMNCKLGDMDRKRSHQIKLLERATQERVSAERTACYYQLDQRATMERADEERRQARAVKELKSWCMSKIQDIDVHLPGQAQYYKLRPSPSVDPSVLDGDPECLPLLSVVSEESSTSLATYVNVLPSPGASHFAGAKRPGFDEAPVVSWPLNSADPQWLHAELQETDSGGPSHENDFSFSSTSSSLSQASRVHRDGELDETVQHARHHKKHLKDRVKGHTNPRRAGGARALEFFTTTEPSFVQERDNLHAMEVTQRFFETVSTQLERWYERKIQEAEKQAEQRVLQDRASLLQRISSLEEELQQLKSGGNTHT